MKKYICIKASPIWYGGYPSKSPEREHWINVGDIYILVSEPTAKSKLYELQRWLERPSKFEALILQVRKSQLRKYFKEMEDNDIQEKID